MKISIILGLGYGDESKGATVNALVNNPKITLVVRFNGGHQVGHTVMHDGIRHAFSNFGSGTLKGAPTYWSEYCTVNPLAVLKEGNILRGLGIEPMIYYNANAMVTTPFDIYSNIKDMTTLSHGSVGVGFGKTIQRNEDHYHLYVRDLMFPTVRDEKLRLIEKYYKLGQGNNLDKLLDEFKLACDDLVKRFTIVNHINDINAGINDYIFEGGQGIMLDMDYGFFPNVTRSYCTSRNAIEIIKEINGLKYYDVETYYVTRAYQTRHGNGFMPNEDMDISYIKINPNETNINTGTQGIFRRAPLDMGQLKYALSCDAYHNNISSKKNLVISCCDHVGNDIPIIDKGHLLSLEPKVIGNWLNVFHVYTRNSEDSALIY